MSPARFDRPSATDAVVLVLTGLCLLGANLLLRWAKAGDDALADLGDEPVEGL